MSNQKKIIVVSTDFGTEQPEIVVPVTKLRELGHEVTVATPSGKDVQTMVGDKDKGEVFPTDVKLSEATGDFDVVLLPGGTLNADAARIDSEIQAIVKKQAEAGRTIAAICHAPWVLVETELAQGKTLTGYESIRTDLANAGATVVDQEVKVCTANGWTLITSRTPDDLDAFVKAVDEA
ncbi:DJ-1/PfpI family protein [Luteococcus peritonei]|uniref:DJ-1/PfpI family protein n=1 Tax=Luteococcus peritonei TaxID=88874 RepID=A0ABW4RSH9_9ACTN